MHCTWAISSFIPQISPYLVFSPFWGENFLVSSGKKHLSPTIFSPLPLPTKHPPKSFPSSFFLSFFFPPILTKIHSIKHTDGGTTLLLYILRKKSFLFIYFWWKRNAFLEKTYFMYIFRNA